MMHFIYNSGITISKFVNWSDNNTTINSVTKFSMYLNFTIKVNIFNFV